MPTSFRDTVWLANQSDLYFFSVIHDSNTGEPNESETSNHQPENPWTGMPSWGDYLSDEQIICVVNYIRSFGYVIDQCDKTIEDYQDMKPDYNRWTWSDIASVLPDAPDTVPEWFNGDSDQ
jgi:hypothetical protein